jgi:hypothetical protein
MDHGSIIIYCNRKPDNPDHRATGRRGREKAPVNCDGGGELNRSIYIQTELLNY